MSTCLGNDAQICMIVILMECNEVHDIKRKTIHLRINNQGNITFEDKKIVLRHPFITAKAYV